MSEQNAPMVSVPWLIFAGVVVGACAAGMVGGPSLVLIFLSACCLSLTIGLVWNSLTKIGAKQTLEFEDALELAAPSATEEQKLAVLRALKDLDYELSVGKISRPDFDQASAEYRAQARLLISTLDESMKAQLKIVEERVQGHLKEAALLASTQTSSPGSETDQTSSPT